jgi:hypothetical protein
MLKYMMKELGAAGRAKLDGFAPFFVASQKGHLDVVHFLATALGVDVNRTEQSGCTALLTASCNGHLDVVRYLVKELDADINQTWLDGVTPLMDATAGNHTEVVIWLFKNGATANAQASREDCGTAVDIRAADIYQAAGATAKQIAYLKARMHCANPVCSGAGLKKCASCLEVFFCSKDCQVAVWPAHKADCKRRVDGKMGKKS